MANKGKLINLAQKAMSRGQWDKAIQTLERVLSEDPLDVRNRLKLGDVYAKKGDRERACAVYRDVAEAHADQGFFMKAVAVYKQVLKIDPQHGDAALRTAELHEQLGLAQEAMVHFQLALPLLEAQGLHGRVLQVLERILELDPDNVAARIKLAETLSRAGERERAVEHFAAAATTLKQQARIEDYVKVAERLIFHDKTRMEVLKDLAQLYLGRGDTKRALSRLQDCFRHAPRDIETLTLLAKAFADLGQVQKTVYVYRELARVHEEEGRLAEAREVHRVILQHQPDDPEALRALGLDDGGGVVSDQPPMPPSMDIPFPDNATGALPIDASQDLREPRLGVPPEARFNTDDLKPASLYSSGGQSPARPVTSDLELDAPEPAPTREAESQVERIVREAEVYIRYNLPGKAIEHLQQAFRVDPESVLVYRRLHDVYLSMNDRPRAAEAMANVLLLLEREDDLTGAASARAALQALAPEHPTLRGGVARPADAFVAQDVPSVDLIDIDEGSSDIDPGDIPDLIPFEPPEEIDIDTGEFHVPARWAPRPAGGPDPSLSAALSTHAGSMDLEVRDRVDPVSEAMEVEADQLEASELAPEYLEALPEDAPPSPLGPPPPLPEQPNDDEGWEPVSDFQGGPPIPDDEAFDLEDAVAALEAAGRGQRGRDLDPYDSISEPLLLTDEVSDAEVAALEPGDAGSEPVLAGAGMPVTPDAAGGEPPLAAVEAPPSPPPGDDGSAADLADELEEVRFFLDNDLVDEAVEALEGLKAAYPDHPEVARMLAEARGDDPLAAPLPDAPPVDEALSVLDGSPTQEPSSAREGEDPGEGLYDQGMAHQQIGQLDEAMRYFRAAAEASPARAADALEMVSRCLVESGRVADGVSVLEEALGHAEGTPAEANLRYEIGDAYERLGEFVKAREWFDSCQAIAPSHRDVEARILALPRSAAEGRAAVEAETASALPQRRSKISYL